jgi:hypothetical protein
MGSASITADTSEMEAEIDKKVYELYGITDPKEIAIISAAPISSKKDEVKESTAVPEVTAVPPTEPAPKRRGRKPKQAAELDF